MIIGIAGLKGSGKDTVGAYLIKEHGFERKSFAEPLKRSVAALLDISMSDIEKYKNDECIAVELLEYAEMNERNPKFLFVNQGVTMREFLQRYGTEAHRDIFGEDFWIDATLPLDGYYAGRAIVVTDVRFANEAARVSELGGKVWLIERTGLEDKDPHSSEQIDFGADCLIMNDSTIEDLYVAVEEALGLEYSAW